MNKTFRRFFCCFLAFSICIAILISFRHIMSANYVVVSATPAESKLIIVDAGHGGLDGGAVGYNNVIEKDINLAISKKLKTMLECCGFQVIMTRSEDCMLGDATSENTSTRQKKVTDIRTRVSLINSHPNAIVLSIHQNLFSESRYTGAQMFYSKKNAESKEIAEFLQTRFSTMLQKNNTRTIKAVGDNIYLMNNITVPAVLVECGFISNALEAANLSDDEYQNKIAFVIYAALSDYFEKDIVDTNIF